MKRESKKTQIAFRCPACGVATVGFFGSVRSVSDLIRLKCECGESSLDIKNERDGRVHLSVPCVYCKDSHGYLLSDDILDRSEPTRLSCPYSGMNIAFMAEPEALTAELERSAEELSRILASFEAEELSDIQPEDLDSEAAPPDPAVFDAINFLVRDLEADGKIECPCKSGSFELRFTDTGIQVYCTKCGASYTFFARTAAMAEEYLGLDSLILK